MVRVRASTKMDYTVG